MNNFLSYYGLFVAKIRVSDKDFLVSSLYLEPVSILNESQGRNEKSQMEFTMLDYAAIRDIFETGPELFKLLGAEYLFCFSSSHSLKTREKYS